MNASPFISWISNECFGLNYDRAKSNSSVFETSLKIKFLRHSGFKSNKLVNKTF